MVAVTVAGTVAAASVGVAVAGAGAAGAGAAGTRTASAAAMQARPAHASRSARVVKVRHRRHFGRMLVTAKKGRALYILPHGHCGSACLSVWPRLVLPKGKTRARGSSCLGTAKFGSHHRRQVTYHGKRLYTFVDDSGHSVRGNDVQGFKAARKVRCTM